MSKENLHKQENTSNCKMKVYQSQRMTKDISILTELSEEFKMVVYHWDITNYNY